MMQRTLTLCVFALLASACQAAWPLCQDDNDCDGQVCLNGMCAQCRDDGHCADQFDVRFVCERGACVEVAGFCDREFPCARGQRCRRLRCGPWCLHADDCAEGESCEGGLCASPCECVADLDCPHLHVCRDCACVLADLPHTVHFAPGEARIEIPTVSRQLADRVGQAPLVDPDVGIAVWCGPPDDALAMRRHAAIVDALLMLEFPGARILRPLGVEPDIAAALPDDACDIRWARPLDP